LTEGTFYIKPRRRNILDTGAVETDQPLAPYTGVDHSGPAMTSAIAFYMNHDHPAWHEDAACRDKPQEWFYGDEDRADKARHHPSLTVNEVARARDVCNECPVQMQCLEWAIVNREEFGIWGGSTAGQRKRWIKAFEAQQNVSYLTDYDDTYEETYSTEWDDYPDEMTG
jgi:hypothetical protein